MRECDRYTIEELGLPGIALMETAGQGATRSLLALCEQHALDATHADIGIFTGSGNNGGDGFVIARALLNQGFDVRVYLLGPRTSSRGDANQNLDILEQIINEDLTPGRGTLKFWGDMIASGTPIGNLLGLLPNHRVIVDAMLGTGLSSPLRSPYAEVVTHLNASSSLRFAVDIPTGLSSDSGQPLGPEALQAHKTATFGLGKVGLWVYPGRNLCGKIDTIDIGIPPGVFDRAGINTHALTAQALSGLLPTREATGHKGSFGHVLTLGGAAGKVGALALTSISALRAGSGLVTAGGASGHVDNIINTAPEIMTEAALTGSPNPEVWSKLLHRKDAIAAGPGLGTSSEAHALIHWLLGNAKRPLVLDADALNIIASDPNNRAKLADTGSRIPVVLTPHPGEFARLLGSTSREVLSDPIQHARQYAAETGCIVVFKSASTIVAHPDGPVAINTTGNAGMGTAGSGDVLTGLIASLIASSMTAWEAAQVAVFLHGLSGDIASQTLGQHALIASDLIRFYPEAFRACR